MATINLNPGYRGRVRTGCVTCRLSKVRCDETRPICKRCARLARECTYKLKPAGRIPVSSPGTTEAEAEAGSPALGADEIVSIPSVPVSPISSIETASSSLQARMVSQDLYLCTTIDLIAANSASSQYSITYFIQQVECPLITPYDTINWKLFKEYVAEEATQCIELAAAIQAVQSMHKALANGLLATRALSVYETALGMLKDVLGQQCTIFKSNLLHVAFLMVVAQCFVPEMVQRGPFDGDTETLQRILLNWAPTDMCAVSKRVIAWLLIVHAAARRGGNPGILSKELRLYFTHVCHEPPTSLIVQDSRVPVPLPVSVLADLCAPLFLFCLRLQILAGQVADLSHYHRSRVTSDDQEEVATVLHGIEKQMYELWVARPTHMQSSPSELQTLLAPSVSGPLLTQIAICKVMYQAELIELGRNLSDPPLASEKARSQMKQMQLLLENPKWPMHDAASDGALSVGFLRPLLMYAIESIHESETVWAVNQMRRIRNTIARSDFFASFAEGLAQAQREKRRRVTTRWFCLEAFETTPPYL